jgi:hypothetical protein
MLAVEKIQYSREQAQQIWIYTTRNGRQECTQKNLLCVIASELCCRYTETSIRFAYRQDRQTDKRQSERQAPSQDVFPPMDNSSCFLFLFDET